MSVFCGGNPGVAKPGFAASIFIGPSSIAALLNNVPVGWAVPLAAYIGAITYDLTILCPGEPPSLPTINASDITQLLAPQGDPVGYVNAVAKFQQLIGAYAWPAFCECSGVATPPPPTPPVQPTGAPAINPTQIPAAPSGPCFATSGDFVIPHSSGFFQPSLPGFQIPPGATQARYTVTNTSPGGGATFPGAQLEAWPNRGAFTGTPDLSPGIGSIAPGVTLSTTMTTIPHPAYFWVMELSASGTVDGTAHLLAEFFCGSIGTPAAPCCPPDPLLSGQVSQILSIVTLMQRQTTPFAYVTGTAHSVSGHGQFAVSGLIGTKTVITSSIPPSIGIESGDPDEYFGLGWTSWGNADGFGPREFLGHIDNVSLPGNAGQYTIFGYSLAPGITATITELIREP